MLYQTCPPDTKKFQSYSIPYSVPQCESKLVKICKAISVRKSILTSRQKNATLYAGQAGGTQTARFMTRYRRQYLCLTKSRTLEDEDGNEVTFEVIDALDHKGVHYLAVVEYTENEEDAEDAQLVILSVGEDDEGEYLDVVEDDETLLEVSKLFEQRLSDDYEID